MDTNTKLLLHADETAQSFFDSSYYNHPISAAGDVIQSSTQSVLGGKSAYFDGSGDYLTVPDSEDWNFGTGDFTIDFWTRFNSVGNNQFVAQGVDGNNDWYFGFWQGRLFFYHADASAQRAYYAYDWAPNTGAWYHLALARSGANLLLFINGNNVSWTNIYTPISSNNLADISYNLTIGYSPYLGAYQNGYIDEFRISRGIARWTSNFVPPTSSYNP